MNATSMVAFGTIGTAAHLVELASEYALDTRLDRAAAAGRLAGYLYKWAHRLHDEGAHPADVKRLIAIGLRAGGANG